MQKSVTEFFIVLTEFVVVLTEFVVLFTGNKYTGDMYGLAYHRGMPFSTYDHDNDDYEAVNCAEISHGAWWYNVCTYVNLNGNYETPGMKSNIDYGRGGMIYWTFKKYESLKSSKLMFRRV